MNTSRFTVLRQQPEYAVLTSELKAFLTEDTDAKSIGREHVENPPLLSIITPSFNQGEFLERTITSVMRQNACNAEHIVMDGGSLDNSGAILTKYSGQFAACVMAPDEGQADAINKGLARARGEWICFQNSDDLFTPGAFTAVTDAIRKYPDCEAIQGHFLHIDENDNVRDCQLALPSNLNAQLTIGIQLFNQALFIKRSVFESIGDFDSRYQFSFDYEYYCRMLAHNVRVAYVDYFVGCFRHHAAAKSSRLLHVARSEHQEIIARYSRGNPGMSHRLLAPFRRSIRGCRLARRYGLWYITRKLAE